jgi:hypothetical protein
LSSVFSECDNFADSIHITRQGRLLLRPRLMSAVMQAVARGR